MSLSRTEPPEVEQTGSSALLLARKAGCTLLGAVAGALVGALGVPIGWGFGWFLTALFASLALSLTVGFSLLIVATGFTARDLIRILRYQRLDSVFDPLGSIVGVAPIGVGMIVAALDGAFVPAVVLGGSIGAFVGLVVGLALPMRYWRMPAASEPTPSPLVDPSVENRFFESRAGTPALLLGFGIFALCVVFGLIDGGLLGFAIGGLFFGLAIGSLVVGTFFTSYALTTQFAKPIATAGFVGLISLWIVGLHEAYWYYNYGVSASATNLTKAMHDSLEKGSSRQVLREDLRCFSRHELSITASRPYRWALDQEVSVCFRSAMNLVDLADGERPRYLFDKHDLFTAGVEIAFRTDTAVTNAATDLLLREWSLSVNRAAHSNGQRCLNTAWSYRFCSWLAKRREDYLKQRAG